MLSSWMPRVDQPLFLPALSSWHPQERSRGEVEVSFVISLVRIYSFLGQGLGGG